MPSLRLLGALTLALALAQPVWAGFSLALPAGDKLDVRTWGDANRGPLFIWLLNQYGETRRADALAQALADRGATVWRVDLLDALMLERTAEAIRNMDGRAVADLLAAGEAQGRRPIVLVACDRMAVPLLKGLREWQGREPRRRARTRAEANPPAVAGGVLFFPNLYRGTPVAGEAPELMDIVDASNMPLAIVQPALGAHRNRLPELLARLHGAGSPALAWLLPEVRDYYLMQSEKPESESLQALGGPVPGAVERAIADTPSQLLTAARLLDASPRPSRPRPLAARQERAAAPAYGLVERPGLAAPAFALADARGRSRGLVPGQVTLVNFWATWCPPCIHEIPSMNRLAAAYPPGTFEIVSVNFKEDPAHVSDFLKRVDVAFPVLLDRDGEAATRWKVFAFPSSFLVDRAGRIRYSVNTAIEWDSAETRAVIDRLVREPPPRISDKTFD
jgi:thiol-disulfide isomerase/thioredoxin